MGDLARGVLGEATMKTIFISQPSAFSGMNTDKLLGGERKLAESIIDIDGIEALRKWCQGTVSRFEEVYSELRDNLNGEAPLWENLNNKEKDQLGQAVKEDMHHKRWGGLYERFLEVFVYEKDWFFKKLAYDVCRNNARRLNRPTAASNTAKAVLVSTNQLVLDVNNRNKLEPTQKELEKLVNILDEVIEKLSKVRVVVKGKEELKKEELKKKGEQGGMDEQERRELERLRREEQERRELERQEERRRIWS